MSELTRQFEQTNNLIAMGQIWGLLEAWLDEIELLLVGRIEPCQR
jgi:hypothetical protein